MEMEDSYYSKDYWFENPEEHNDVDNYGPVYYVNHIYKDIIFKLQIPDEGFIVVLGTNKCVSFELLCDFYGEERCIGYDINNPNRHSKSVTEQKGVNYKDLAIRERPQKHRYIYFTGNKKQVIKLKKELNYKIEPYPKGINKRYDSSYKPTIQKELF